MQPTLYSHYNCPHSLKAAFFLSEKGISFERIEIDMSNKQQKTPAYLAKNPKGTVPTYEDNQGLIGDSLDIMRYVDANTNAPKLFPDNPDDLADVLGWIARADHDFWDVSHHLYWQVLDIPAEGTDWDEVDRLMRKGHDLLSQLEAALSQNDFICGAFSAADIAVLPWVYGFKRFDGLLDVEKFSHVVAWCDALSQKEAFQSNYRVKGTPFQVETSY
ncbi:MAG: glutathione S-transferase family protein [Phototrophicaceae bacterium]